MNRFEYCFLARHFAALRSSNFSFSNEGEDIALLKEIGPDVKNGFYVDVGSNHPIRYNNMMGFYLRGWNGINIDPLPGSKAEFDRIRKRDINIEMGVATERGTLTYYGFKEPAEVTRGRWYKIAAIAAACVLIAEGIYLRRRRHAAVVFAGCHCLDVGDIRLDNPCVSRGGPSFQEASASASVGDHGLDLFRCDVAAHH